MAQARAWRHLSSQLEVVQVHGGHGGCLTIGAELFVDHLRRRVDALAEYAPSIRPSTSSGLYKAEVIHRRGPWRSFEPVEFATLEWVDWFNNRRLLEPIGNIPPAEAEQRYHAMLDQPAMAA